MGVKEEGEVGGGRGKGVSLCKSTTPLAPMGLFVCTHCAYIVAIEVPYSLYGFSRRECRGC